MTLRWPRDTIAWRFGVVIAAAIAVTSVIIALFANFGGVWAQPLPDLRALMEGATAVADIIDAAPAQMRPRLTQSTNTESYSLRWYTKDSDAVRWLDSVRSSKLRTTDSDVIKELERLRRPFVVTGPKFTASDRQNSPLRLSHDPDTHYLAVKLRDGSWLAFVGSNRSWGLSKNARIAMKFILFLMVATAICAIATRLISSPIRQFAEAVHAAGVNPNAAPIAETGPQELREVIAAFNGMQAKIAAFVAYRTAMLAAISHDLRTPLTRMRLRGEYIADPVQRERLFGDVLEMQAMVDGALAFFRGDADEEPVRTFDLSGLLQSIADGFADQGIEVDYTEGERVIYAGRAIAIKRAVTNLVENAVKYGALPSLTLTTGTAQVTVTVRDHGLGIPADALEKVFEPFYRLDKSRHKATGGVGLGLTAARAVIRSHGGDIALRNHPDGGLEATVTLPRVEPPL